MKIFLIFANILFLGLLWTLVKGSSDNDMTLKRDSKDSSNVAKNDLKQLAGKRGNKNRKGKTRTKALKKGKKRKQSKIPKKNSRRNKKKKSQKRKIKIKRKKGKNKKNRKNQNKKQKKEKRKKITLNPRNTSDCTEKNITKEMNWKKQYKYIKIIYEQLSNKANKVEIFSNYSDLLGEMTKNGTSCGQQIIAAYTYLSNCPSTVSKACDVSNFSSAYDQAKKCQEEGVVTCSKFPSECKLTEKYGELREKRKEECLNRSSSGSFISCMNYVKSNLNTDILTCVREIKNTTETPSASDTANDVIETKTIFTEGDEVVEQSESYNPDTNEVTLSVPAHGSNVALTAIIGEESMVTAFDNYCVVGDPPANHTNSVSEDSNSTDEAEEIDSNTIVKVYYLNVVEGEMTEAERDALPESFKTACKDKPIQKTKKVVVDEATFNQDNFAKELKRAKES